MANNKARIKSKRKSPIPTITFKDLGRTGMNAKAKAKLLQIVQVAAELFHQKGYSSTTTRDIGNACNISPGHLYYYINSKEDFIEIFREIQENDLEKWEKMVHKWMKQLTPDELLKETIRDFVHYIHARRRLVVFWYYAFWQIKPEHRSAIVQIEARTVNLFKEIIELGCKERQFHVNDPFILACNIHMMCVNWAMKRYLIKDSLTNDQYADTCVELVTAMVHGVPDHHSKKS